MKCDVIYAKGQTRRPAYVPATFRGMCKVFPRPLLDGSEPRFLSYQTEWVMDNGIMLLAEKSRQVGWTWGNSYSIARQHSVANYTTDTWGTSRDDLQAKLAIQDCKAFANVLNAGAKDLGELVLDTKGHSAHVLSFANNTKYYSLSSNPDAQAGKRGNRVADEFALNKDNRQLYSIMEPGVTWGGSIKIFSTHRGSGNYFNTLITEARENSNPKGFRVYRVTLQDALDCGFLFKLQSILPADDPRQQMDEAAYFAFVKSKSADDETFLQEYMCLAADDAAAFISYEILDGNARPASETAYTLEKLRACPGDLYMGIDIGRTTDLTVFWIVEKYDGMYFTRKLHTMKNEKFSIQEAQFYEYMALPNMRRCCIDSTGIGMQFAERGTERYHSRVEGVHFTGPVKEQLAYPLRNALEDKSFKIPLDMIVESDFRSIRKLYTAAGNIRFAGERTANGHADRFWGAALSIHAASTGKVCAFPPMPGKGRRASARRARRQSIRDRQTRNAA